MDKELSPNGTGDSDLGVQLHRAVTNGSISPEMFEKLFLQPQSRVAGDLRKTFANPTPVAVMGFSVGLTPLSIAFMGWRGAGGNGVATVSATLWFGGVLLIIAGIGEFLLGNAFPFVVFMGYGAHFLTFGTTFIPWFNAVGFFSGGDPTMLTPEFVAGYGFYTVSLALLSFFFLICSIRTNAIFVAIFLFATTGFGLASGSFWNIANGNMVVGNRCLVGTGACFFAAAMLGWYLFAAIMFQIMDLPIPSLPVFDLSTVIKAKSELRKKRA